MSFEMAKVLARGMQAHQILANNELAYSFTVAQQTAVSSATTVCLSVLGDLAGAGRSNATSLGALISTNQANAASGGWQFRFPGGVLAGPVKYEFQVVNAGSATQIWSLIPFVSNQSSRVDFRIFTMPAAGGVAWAPPASTDTYSITCVIRGWALNTGFPV